MLNTVRDSREVMRKTRDFSRSSNRNLQACFCWRNSSGNENESPFLNYEINRTVIASKRLQWIVLDKFLDGSPESDQILSINFSGTLI